MPKELIIRSSDGRGKLILSRVKETEDPQLDSYMVTLEDDSLRATFHIPSISTDEFQNLFATMADNWDGWSGKLTFGSMRGNFAIECTTDIFGHVSVLVRLAAGDEENPYREVLNTLVIDAGQLQDIAKEVREFLPQ